MFVATLALWIGSIGSGWKGFFPWLAVPPILYAGFVMFRMFAATSRMGELGVSGKRFANYMLGPSFLLVVWNTVLNSAIFGLGRLIAYLRGN